MQRFTRVRTALTLTAVATAMLATTTLTGVAGASSTSGVYNAADAKLVPAADKGITLQVATDATYPPDESMNGSTMVGFDVDLMGAIATTLGIKVNENNVTFDNIIAGMTSNKYQIGNSSFTDTKAREAQVNFVDYFQAGEGVYAKATTSTPFTGFSSFCGLKVAVETGTVEQTDATTASKSCPAGKKVDVMSFSTQTEANTAVSSGQATFGFADSQISGYIVSTSNGVFKLVGSAVNVAPYGIATQKTLTGMALATAIEAAVKTLIANGTYGAIMAHWGASAGALTASQIKLNGATS
jgi:polar amino acid transport system substrate-binding protein